MTPFTSFLVLESQQAYRDRGMPIRQRFRWGLYFDEVEGEEIATGPTSLPLLGMLGCMDKHEPMTTDELEASERHVSLEQRPEEVPEWLKKDRIDGDQGGKGKRHKGEEGQMGRRDSRKSGGAYAIAGPSDNAEPDMARDRTKELAREAGILSILAEANQNQLGDDPLSGLGLNGTGRGGGGEGEGSIGLGAQGTIGHGGGGGGSGYGRGVGGLGTKKGKAPKVKTGSALVHGALSKEIIRRVIRRHLNEVKYCYEKQLPQAPDMAGVVSVKFIINGTGNVQNSAVSNSSLGSAPVEQCVAQAVRRWTFPAPDGGGIVIVTYPFSFDPGDGPPPKPVPVPAPEIAVAPPTVATPAKKKPLFRLRTCSDASRRPLYHRRILWQRRLAYAAAPDQVLRIFTEAGERCELKTWRARKTMLDLIERRVRSPEAVGGLIAAFKRYPGAQRYLRRKIMRHALDPDLTMGLWFGHAVNWGAVQRGLVAIKDPKKRVVELRKILEKHPNDPAGRNLLVATLFTADEMDEARAEATRLRRDGLATPVTLAILCDLQAEAGLEDEARRSCSELVEFNADDQLARQRLGDLFLRHGWYGAAYRQYRTLVDVLGSNKPSAQLRLAAAAAGMGKVDEALRIERKVSSGDGEPGPADPRRWARLHSAARLSRMILEARAANEADKVKALERSLKRTQVFGAPTKLVVLVWEDLEAVLDLVAEVDKKPFSVSDRVVSPWTGLMMIDVGETPPEELKLSIELRSGELKRAVGFSLITIAWDGKSFTLDEKRGELPAAEEELSLNDLAAAEVASEEG
jgi:TonB family protein